MIKIKNLTLTYDNGVTPFKDICFDIQEGDVLTLIGPSGTGKTSLLRCINKLNTPTSGEIYYNDINILDKKTNINEIRKHIGMVFQSFNLFPHLTVVENIMFPQMELLKRSKQESYDKAIELLKTVGLLDKALNYPDELSGGQKQRAAIARTLGMDCEVILFDEPTSALDPTMVNEVSLVIKKLANSGKTMVIVTHEMSLAKEISNRIIFLSDGGICEDGSPEQIFEHPKKEETRRFIYQIESLSLLIDSEKADFFSMSSKIKEFGVRYSATSTVIKNMLAVFEELVWNLLFSILNEIKPIIVNIEYLKKNDAFQFSISYFNKEYNPFIEEDKFEIIIIKAYTKSLIYSFDKEEKKNKILLLIKDKK